jgi:hypothetical protein
LANVSSVSCFGLVSARDTVMGETPARRATSASVRLALLLRDLRVFVTLG